MVMTLLPASAAAFAPRGAPTVVLGSRAEQWLTVTLKRVNRVKRPLNNVTQHTRCLTDLLSSTNAIWNLCSIMVPKTPESQEPSEEDRPRCDPMFNYHLIHIEAYVVHVDMVSQQEVAFKLTPETIESLVDYHRDIYSVDTAANTWDWPEKEIQLKKLQEDFVQAANKFVYRASATVLEGMEEEGAGELLAGRSEDAKAAILGLFVPLLPPPPRIVDVVRAAPLLPSSTGPEEDWWHHSPAQHSPSPPISIDSWRTPSPIATTTTSSDASQNMWTNTCVTMSDMQLPSPVLAQSPPYLEDPFSDHQSFSDPQFYSSPETIAVLPHFFLPGMLAQQQCSSSVNMMGMGWNDRYDFALPYGTTM